MCNLLNREWFSRRSVECSIQVCWSSYSVLLHSISLLNCPDVPSIIEIEVLTFAVIRVELSISTFHYGSYYLIYFEALFLGTCMFIIVIASLWIGLFIIIKYTYLSLGIIFVLKYVFFSDTSRVMQALWFYVYMAHIFLSFYLHSICIFKCKVYLLQKAHT